MSEESFDYEVDIYRKIYWISSDLNVFLQVFTIITNVFHLIFLLQKELRSGAIYILMIGIGIADVINFLFEFYNIGIERYWWYPFDEIPSLCLKIDLAEINLFFELNQTIIHITRPVAVWLAILMALIRTLSVMFPMSNWIQNMTKSRNVIFMIFAVFGFWMIFYVNWIIFLRIVWYPDVLDKSCFYYNRDKQSYQRHALVMDKDRYIFLFSNENLEPIVRFVPTICYPILTVALIFQLRSIKKKRENVQKSSLSDQSDKTTKLILAMTICFMLSEGLCGLDAVIIQVLNRKAQKKYSENLADWISTLGTLQFIFLNLRTFNASTHPFFCFFMSSQYRDTVKRLFCGKKKSRAFTTIKVSTASVSSVSSKKSY
ncbi:hypothetical protein B9Z55_026809 [Caenorhabditis nigoni]|uniref:G-protein coupled receptors family 1 profile domain-containing protein n=1 Tax=Caenorhabditis nigoni TaxID=1611254 RepID=A0A2G5SHI2_9PELO|nr:hypothetical protein B9Z55_026809 [Caenorhabditis nigoni]